MPASSGTLRCRSPASAGPSSCWVVACPFAIGDAIAIAIGDAVACACADDGVGDGADADADADAGAGAGAGADADADAGADADADADGSDAWTTRPGRARGSAGAECFVTRSSTGESSL